MKTSILSLTLLLLLGAAGCELSTNPLLFEGPPITAKFRVDLTGTAFGDAATINLQDAVGGISDVDSVKVFNITLQIDSLTNGTSPATTISGTATLDGVTLFTITNVALSAFSSERSIFDNSLAGFSYNAAGVSHLLSVLRQRPLPTVTLAVGGTASAPTLHFTTKIKLYSQVFTSP